MHTDEMWDKLKTCVNETAVLIDGKERKIKGNGWFDEEWHQMLEEKNKVYKAMININSRSNVLKYHNKRKEVNYFVKRKGKYLGRS